MIDSAIPLTTEVMDHSKMWLPIMGYALSGACAVILAMGAIIWKLYKKCQLKENVDLRKAILNQAQTLGAALDGINKRFELGKKEFARQRKVLRAHLIFMLAVCEAAKFKVPDLECRKIMEALEELEDESEL